MQDPEMDEMIVRLPGEADENRKEDEELGIPEQNRIERAEILNCKGTKEV